MANKKKNNKKLYLIGFILIIIIFVINLTFNQKEKDSYNIEQEEKTEEQIRDIENENTIQQLQDMEERDRMEFYFGMFLNYVEAEEYEKAYDLLYEEFKKNYFPTVDSFIKYAKEKIPQMPIIQYENIERNGDVYVLWIHMFDALGSKSDDAKKEMNVVIQEKDYNDFVMSFSVV